MSNHKNVRRALIIAAGRGVRLNPHNQELPKCLVRIGARSIIETTLTALQRTGIQEVFIVTGYKHESLSHRLGDGYQFGLRLHYIFNEQWRRENGLSVYAARECFDARESFLLLMGDHLFAPEILTVLMATPLAPGEIALAVDSKLASIFDLDDATKVIFDGTHIRAIGKTLTHYNGVDCGLFKCTPSIFQGLKAAMVNGDCSLADGCRHLIAQGKMRGVDIGNAFWVDIDTPAAVAYAREHYA
jgi:choline kinase